ncbi:unnamed protein product [Amoebophrya sp. A120]|nr:unnamed protein product [Amoebophrya sp. A120]|eukprot:GSA120T00019179001.1
MLRSSLPRFILRKFESHLPTVAESAFVAPSADVIGNVKLGENSSVWYNCVLRGDVNFIEIGKNSNVQDGTVIHVRSDSLGGNKPNPTIIGDNVTIGHSCLIHACTLESNSFVGMQSCVMDFARIESNGYLGAGSLLLSGKVIPANELWAGRPAKFVRELKPEEVEFIQKSAREYAKFGSRHKVSVESE